MQKNLLRVVSIREEDILREEQLGQGSYGVTWKGKLNQTTDVAIKYFYCQNLPQEVMKDFEDQTIRSVIMQHPNVIQYHGYCANPAQLIMEILPCTLYQFIHSQREMPWELKIQIGIDIASGLQYIHSRNFLHRDFKSNNVLLDHNNRAKITDFGQPKIKSTSKSLDKRKDVPIR